MKKNQDLKDQLMSIEDFATTLGLSPWTIRAWIRDGKLNSFKVGSRRLLSPKEIDRLTKEGFQPASKELVFA
jgi:excisionase family DNA binding protein